MRYFCLLLFAFCLAAAPPLPLPQGFQHFYNLEYDQAIAAFERQTRDEPGLPDGYNHLAQAIVFRDMFRAGALESELVTGNNPFLRRPKVNASPEDQKRFAESIGTAMMLAQEMLGRNPRDVHALYCLGVSYGLRANYNFLVRKAWRDALRDATTARKYHNKTTEIDPSFVDGKLTQGAHDYIVGSLPFHLRLLGFLVGFRGNKDEGIRTLQTVAHKGIVNRIDAEILLCAIYRREKKVKLAIPLLVDLTGRFPRNYLLRLELAQMFSEAGDKNRALAVLDWVDRRVSARTPGYSRLRPERVAYARGNLQFWYNDLDQALMNLKVAVAHAEDLDLNTGVLAWMRIGQIYDLKGLYRLAADAYWQAIRFAPDSDAARESQGYLSSPYRRQKAKT
jgi:hypothetical protein